MTGGAFKNSSNLLSRRREIEEFEKHVVVIKDKIQEIEESATANFTEQKMDVCKNQLDAFLLYLYNKSKNRRDQSSQNGGPAPWHG